MRRKDVFCLQIFSDDLYEDNHVVITGGSSGVGLGIGERFAKKGADLSLIARDNDKLTEVQNTLEDQYGVSVRIFSCDVRDYDRLDDVIDSAVEALGAIDVLVCSAAGNFPAAASEMSENAFESVVAIDLLGTFNTCRVAHDRLNSEGASIIAISAPQSDQPMPLQSHAGAAKAGIDNLVRNLALEWSDNDIRVNAIRPGPVADTEGLERLTPDQETRESLSEALPVGRFVEKSEIGALCLYLASPLAECMTGSIITIDCGQTLLGSGALMEAMSSDE